MALKKLRDQFSSRDCRTVYKNAALDPFHTPQAPSFCQTAEITFVTESARRMLRKWSGMPGFFGSLGEPNGESDDMIPFRFRGYNGVGVSCIFDVK